TAQNSGVLRFDGTNTTANLGSITLASGGHAYLNGTLVNTGDTLNAPTGGSFELLGGTIQGGTVAAGALAFTTSGGYLDGVTYTGDLAMTASSQYVRFLNGTTFTGANASFATSSGLYWSQTGTLTGKTLTLANGAYLYVNGVGNSLTLDATTVLNGNASLYTDGSAGTSIINQGTLNHTGSSAQIYAANFTNAGTINATAGTLQIGTTSSGYVATNAAGGVINVNGANTYLYAPTANPFINNGTINVQSGTLFTGTYVTNGPTGRIGGAGTINGNLTLGGGTLAPGNSIGNLTLTNTSFTVTNPSVFEVELGGTNSDRLTFVNPVGPVNIGSGLLNLSIILLAPPQEGTVYTIMNISSGGSGITGTFFNLPNSGSALIANYAGTDYTLNVYYLANSITLQVPEPGTYALMGTGLALLAFRHLRSRRSRRS
ncbi:MAG: PEP-CTERM sorting domain-containing protein, partial [Opitutaceae bacterium]|nr:PEP-CTERM sorting domain-containing protein [Opitutaceae bacterium]